MSAEGMVERISRSYRALLEAAERRLIVGVLVLHGWDRQAAADVLGISPALLGARCMYFGLSGLHPHPNSAVMSRPPPARRKRRRTSGTKLGKWRELPPPSPQAFPMSVYQDRKATIERMLGAGATYAEIGVALGGLTRERVRQLCHRFGLDHHAGRRARARQSARREVERWRRKLDPQVASVVAWLDRQGMNVEPESKHRFRIGDDAFCVHRARVARATSPDNSYHRYYRFHGTCELSMKYIVCVTRDGRRFVIPQSQWGTSIYVPEHDDGAWAGFRDRWPMIATARSA